MPSSLTPALTWALVAPGVCKAVIGQSPTLTPLATAGSTPRAEAMACLPDVTPPFGLADVTWETVSGKLVVRLPLEEEEAVWGLGLQFHRLDHRGRTRYLRVNSDPKEDTGETHAPVPFYVTSRGYGVLANTARIPTFYCGSSVRKGAHPADDIRDRGRDPQWAATPKAPGVEIVVADAGLELYVFAGPTPLDAVRRYNLFCGGGVLPPRWGLGFWHRVHYQHNAGQVLAEARQFRERGVPCDVIGLEPGWHSKSYPCTYEWAADRFPDPDAFLREMSADGFRVNLWEHAYVSPEAAIYPALEPLSGSHTVWGGLAPDFTLPEAVFIVQEQHDREHLARGVSGYKIDECDGSELTGNSWMFPGHARFPSGHDGEELRQLYGLQIQRFTTELFHRLDRRTYGLVRASNAGAAPLPYVLYSDLYDHRQFVRALCNASFCGLLWTPEIRSAKTAEEWVRRMQVVCLSPLAMLNAWASSTQPWSFPEVEPIIRKYLELRMRLLPYLYSAFAEYYFEGTPPFRAMALEGEAAGGRAGTAAAEADLTRDAYGSLEARGVDDQYMVGPSLLVAPVFAGETSREVALPPGVWYDWDTSERFEGGRKVRIFPGLDTLPIFVREGAVIPLMPALPHAPRAGEPLPLEVRHYGPVPGRFRLFDDDGETFAYERGEYRWRDLEVTGDAKGRRAGTITAAEEGWQSSYGEVTWTFLGC